MRGIPPHALPPKQQREAEARAGDERREDEQDQRREVVDGLERRDLGRDLEGGQLREGARARGLAASRHCLFGRGKGGQRWRAMGVGSLSGISKVGLFLEPG